MKIDNIFAFLMIFLVFLPFANSGNANCQESQTTKSLNTYYSRLPVDEVMKQREYHSEIVLTDVDDTSKLDFMRAYSQSYAIVTGAGGIREYKITLTSQQSMALAEMKAAGKSDDEIKKQIENYLKGNAYLELSKMGLTYTIEKTTDPVVYDINEKTYVKVDEYKKKYGGREYMHYNDKEYVVNSGIYYDSQYDVFCSNVDKSCVNEDLAIQRGWITRIRRNMRDIEKVEGISLEYISSNIQKIISEESGCR